uniref:Uncharacterized protein n=1 Tax=Arundo donax TaxID=35708 RepID=A0A0A9B6V8_ARUDO
MLCAGVAALTPHSCAACSHVCIDTARSRDRADAACLRRLHPRPHRRRHPVVLRQGHQPWSLESTRQTKREQWSSTR